jgi:xylonate dehydratase
MVGEGERRFSAPEAARILAQRPPLEHLKPNRALPDDTRLWAALQQLGGGTWGGCVYDVESILAAVGSFGQIGQSSG